jgi:pimeloyl-ACP methyl ester carboxylesterase
MTALRRTLTITLTLALGVVPLASAQAAPSGPAARPAALAADSPSALAPYYSQQLAWSACGDMQCTWLTVPLDYGNPAGTTIRLRVARVPAAGSAAQRMGSLVVNPGGPGASGLDFASYMAGAVSPAVSAAYDLVGFDTRGVGKSAPITCMSGAQTTRFLRTDPAPGSRAEELRLWRVSGQIPRGCLAMSPEMARHVGSDDTVRDMDILRAALGDTHLTYLGFSYGTFLGTLYAEMFPDTVGRLVLDGAIDPSLDVMQVSQGQSGGFQRAVTRFAADCATKSLCPWRGSTTAVLTGINALLARLDRTPMPTHMGAPLVKAEALSAIFYAMYSPDLWPLLRQGLRQARNGDGLGLQQLADYASDRTGPTTYSSNMASAFPAISCWDTPPSPGIDGLRAAAAAWSKGAAVPDMAKAMSWGNAPCSQWYGHSSRKPAPAVSTTTAPLLVVGTIYDPATPYQWAQALSRQLTTSRLLTYNGDGHTAYGGNSRCIDSAVDAYLLSGALPAVGTICR